MVSFARRIARKEVAARTDDASSRNERVDTAKLVDNSLEALLDALLARDVAPESNSLDLALLGLPVLLEPRDEVDGGLLGHLLVEVEDGDRVRAGLGEGTRDQVAQLRAKPRVSTEVTRVCVDILLRPRLPQEGEEEQMTSEPKE